MWMRWRSAGWWCHACGTSCSAPPWCSVRRERWCHFCTYKLHCSILFNNLNVTLLNPPQHFLVLIIIHSLLPYFIGYLELPKLCIFSACYDGVKILTRRREVILFVSLGSELCPDVTQSLILLCLDIRSNSLIGTFSLQKSQNPVNHLWRSAGCFTKMGAKALNVQAA